MNWMVGAKMTFHVDAKMTFHVGVLVFNFRLWGCKVNIALRCPTYSRISVLPFLAVSVRFLYFLAIPTCVRSIVGLECVLENAGT